MAIDEGVQDLGQFCSVMAATSERLKEDTSTLEQHGDDVDRLDGNLEDGFGALADELEGFLDGLGDAEDAAVAEVGTLAEGAESHADRLTALEQEIEASEDAFEERVESHGGALDGSFSELTQDGFEALSTTTDEIAENVRSSAGEGEEAFAGLEGDLESHRQDVEAARGEGVQALTQAAESLSGDATPGLSSDAEACAAGWSDELPETAKAGSTEIGDPAVSVYEGFGEESVADGDDLIDSLSSLAQEAADLIRTEAATEIEDASALVTDQSMGSLAGEQDEARGVLNVGGEMAAALPPLVDDLEIARTVVAEVDGVLAALG